MIYSGDSRIWLEPYWNVNGKISSILLVSDSIWLEPYWNVNKKYEQLERYRTTDLIRTILECKLDDTKDADATNDQFD